MESNLKKFSGLGVFTLLVLNGIVWFWILTPQPLSQTEIYFLDVGQGDSALIMLSGGAKILIDGGPINGRALRNLEPILPFSDRYIDLVQVTHPQQDHYGGLIEILKYYQVGAVLTDGQTSKNASWQEFERVVAEKKIPVIVMNAGDGIQYRDSKLDVLSPMIGETAKDINDLGIVMRVTSGDLKALFTADISAAKEKELARKFDLDVDILKVSHHGSKYSSDIQFLREATPAISVIGVGKNSYGHPTAQTLDRLASIDSLVYRTDKDGVLKARISDGQLRISHLKE